MENKSFQCVVFSNKSIVDILGLSSEHTITKFTSGLFGYKIVTTAQYVTCTTIMERHAFACAVKAQLPDAFRTRKILKTEFDAEKHQVTIKFEVDL